MATKAEKKEKKFLGFTLILILLGFILWLINLTFPQVLGDESAWGKTKEYISKTIHVATVIALAIMAFFISTLFGLAWLGWLLLALAAIWCVLYFSNNLPWQTSIDTGGDPG